MAMGHFFVAVAISFSLFLVAFSSQHNSTLCPSYDGADLDGCRRRDGNEVCEGRGECECGKCVCRSISPVYPDRRYTGSFCECNNYNCEYFQGQLCGGPARGKCVCGECQCTEHHMGPACGCTSSTRDCMAVNGLLCNGKGNCVCGACECTVGSYTVPTCEDCPLCVAPSCEDLDARECQSIKPGEHCYHACAQKKDETDSKGLASRSSASILLLVVLSTSVRLSVRQNVIHVDQPLQ